MTQKMKDQATHPNDLTSSDLAWMLAVADQVRIEERLGGQCGWVAEILAGEHGWDMHAGIYHSTDGYPIGDHMWNYHQDTGTIIDATADQFGEGVEVRVLSPDHCLYDRYRFALDEETELAWLGTARQRRSVEGEYWWVRGKTHNPDVVAYLEREKRYREGV